MYPIAAVVVSEKAGAWLREDGFGHISSFGGAELGCIAAHKVLEICQRPEVQLMVEYISHRMRQGLESIKRSYADFFIGIRQCGLVMGLEFDHPEGAMYVMRALYRNGVWAIFSTLDPRVLQFKPGLLVGRELCEDILNRVETAMGQARAEARSAKGLMQFKGDEHQAA